MTESLGEAVVEVGADTSGLRTDVKKGVSGAFQSANSTIVGAGQRAGTTFKQSFASRLRGLAAPVTAALGVAALTRVATSAVKLSAQYDQTMNVLQAATGESNAAMEELDALALKMGRDTVFSANEAGTAMLELAKGGLTAAQIRAGALESTLTLAAAGGIGLEEAATTASNALNAFNVKAKDSGQVAAALAGGANASTASVGSLAQALAQVGPGAVDAGVSLQETVAVLAAFDNAGIKGSDAGTSFKTMLANLVPTTDKASSAMRRYNLDFIDAEGNFISISRIAEQLKTGFDGLGAAERSAALETIFGSDARRAATILAREGADGLRELIKATNDQGAAEKMAKARMEGTAGALEALSGSWETAQLQLGRAFAPAVIKGAKALSAGLNDLGPKAEQAGKWIADDLIPAISRAADEAKEWLPVIRDVAHDFESALLPPLKLGAQVITTLADAASDLPGPIKTIGVEAIILAVAINKVTASTAGMRAGITANIASLRQWRAEMTYAETRAGAVSAATSKIGSVAKQAAGIGGMLALTQGMSSASDEGQSFGSVLSGTVGGAMTGLAVGGPIGALIGGVAGGGLTALTGAFSDNKREAEAEARALLEAKAAAAEHRDMVNRLTDSLDENTGAFTKNSNEIIRQTFFDAEGETKAWVAALNNAGIANRGIIAAVKGQPAAVAAVNDALGKNTDKLGDIDVRIDELIAKRDALAAKPIMNTGAPIPNMRARLDELNILIELRQKDAQEIRDGNAAIRDGLNIGREAQQQRQNELDDLASVRKALSITRERYEAFPKSIKTRMDKIAGIPRNLADLRQVTKGVENLTKGDWKILLKAAGIDAVGKELNKIAADAAKKGRASGEGFTGGWGGFLEKLPSDMFKQTKKGTDGSKNIAGNGGDSSGQAFGSGMVSGIGKWVDDVAAEARRMVRAAIAAANQEAEIKSPSKKTERIGKFMGAGLEKGLHDSTRSLVDTTKDLIADLLDGVEKTARDRMKRVTSAFAAEAMPLARQIDRVKARIDEMNELRKSTRSGVIDSFSITGAGSGFDSIVASMTASAAKAGQWADALDELRAAGLNKTTLNQLIGAGPESLTQAQALLSRDGGISQINALQAQINSGAREAGNVAGQAMFAGIKSQRASLAAEFRHLAREFARELRTGIRQVSRGVDGRDRIDPVRRTTLDGGTTTVARDGAVRTSDGDDIKIVQNFYGPTTGGERLREINWALRYATGRRGG